MWLNSPKLFWTVLQKTKVAALLIPLLTSPRFNSSILSWLLCPRQAPTATSPTVPSLFRMPDFFAFSNLNYSLILWFYGIHQPIHFFPELCHGAEEFPFLGTDSQPAAGTRMARFSYWSSVCSFFFSNFLLNYFSIRSFYGAFYILNKQESFFIFFPCFLVVFVSKIIYRTLSRFFKIKLPT